MEKQRPKAGVGICVIKDGKVLLGMRKNAHGDGSWSFPGGHLEFNELVEDCAKREVLEETGLSIKNLRLGPYTNDIFEKENKHYVTLLVVADYDSGDLKLAEPERCQKWEWFDWEKLPSPLFLPLQNLLKRKYNPFQLKT
jgi:8-oxo-dGTP diphosphatase